MVVEVEAAEADVGQAGNMTVVVQEGEGEGEKAGEIRVKKRVRF